MPLDPQLWRNHRTAAGFALYSFVITPLLRATYSFVRRLRHAIWGEFEEGAKPPQMAVCGQVKPVRKNNQSPAQHLALTAPSALGQYAGQGGHAPLRGKGADPLSVYSPGSAPSANSSV